MAQPDTSVTLPGTTVTLPGSVVALHGCVVVFHEDGYEFWMKSSRITITIRNCVTCGVRG